MGVAPRTTPFPRPFAAELWSSLGTRGRPTDDFCDDASESASSSLQVLLAESSGTLSLPRLPNTATSATPASLQCTGLVCCAAVQGTIQEARSAESAPAHAPSELRIGSCHVCDRVRACPRFGTKWCPLHVRRKGYPQIYPDHICVAYCNPQLPANNQPLYINNRRSIVFLLPLLVLVGRFLSTDP